MKTIHAYIPILTFWICCTGLTGQTAEFYQKKLDHFKTQRTAGMVMMISAAPVGMLGTYWIVRGDRHLNADDNWGGFWQGSFEIIAGCICAVVSAGLLAGGTVMNVIGNRKVNQYQEKLDGLKVSLYCTPTQAGFTLTYRF